MRKHLLFFIGLLMLFSDLHASHVMGSDITYKCISEGKYAVTIKIYRQCTGVPLTPITTTVSCGSIGPINLTVTRDAIKDITPRCAFETGPCNPQNTSVGAIGIEEHTFTGVLDFNVSPFKQIKDANCCEVRIAYSQCCRDGNTTTGPADNFYADAMINICNAKCNNSPTFKNLPVAFVCCNQPFFFNNGVNDDDRDSLSFSLVTPKTGAATNFAYGPGFSATKPFTHYRIGTVTNPGANPPIGFYFNDTIGDIIFTPTDCNEIGPMAMQVTEWRKDSTGTYKKIGETRRDIELIIRSCPGNNPPKIGGPYSYNVCEGTQLCFTFRVTDDVFVLPPPATTPPPDTVTVTWDFGIPDGTLTTLDPNAREKDVRFCWTPKIGEASSLPYTFTVTAVDNFCRPRPASATRGFKVLVKEVAQADREYKIKECGVVKFTGLPKSNKVNSIVWSILDSTGTNATKKMVDRNSSARMIDSFQFKKGGKYVVRVSVNNTVGCANLYFDTIIVPELLEAELALNDTFVCAGNAITLQARVKNGLPSYSYRWNTANPLDTFSSIVLNTNKDSSISIRVTDREGCKVYDTVLVKHKTPPAPALGPDKRICHGDTVRLSAGYPDAKYSWNNSENNMDIKVHKPGKYIVIVTDSFNCHGTDTFELFVNKEFKANAGPDRKLCLNDTLQITAKGAVGPGTASYEWKQLSGNNRFLVNDEKLLVFEQSDASYELTLTINEAGVVCVSKDTVNISILQLPVLSVTPIMKRCYNYGEIDFQGVVQPSGGEYFYLKDLNLMPNRRSIDASELGYKNKDTTVTITYKYTDPESGCKNSQDFPQQIVKLPQVQLKDTAICEGSGNLNLKQIIVLPKVTVGVEDWKCLESTDAIETKGNNSFLKNNPGNYTLVYKYTDNNSCENSDTAFVQIKALPVINLKTAGPFCADSGQLELSSITNADPLSGTWSCVEEPGLVRNGQILHKDKAGTFTFVYTHDATGCKVDKSIVIEIKALPNVIFTLPAGKTEVCRSEAKFFANAIPAGGKFRSDIPGLINGNGEINPAAKPDDKVLTGSYTLYYEFTDPQTKCSSRKSLILKIQEAPSISITAADPACEDSIFKPEAKAEFAGAGFVWSSSGTGSFDNNNAVKPSYTPSAADILNGTFTLSVITNSFGVCPQASAQSDITIWPKPQGEFVADKLEGCSPLDVNFSLNISKPAGPFKFAWDFGDPESGADNTSKAKDPQHTYIKEGKYSISVKITSEKGCETTISKTAYISVYPVPVADFDIDPVTMHRTVALPKFEFINRSVISNGTLSYEWDFGIDFINTDTSTSKNPVYFYSYNPKDTGSYDVTLRVLSDKGCPAQVIKTIHIGPDITVFIPNAFTPNNFGPDANKRFYVTAQGFTSFNINLYNRWGEMLYTSKDIKEGWDGNYKGAPVQQDVYVYQVEITSLAGKVYKYNGTVTLLR